MQFSRPAGNRQPETAAARFRRKERLEDLLANLGGDTGPRIADLNTRLVVVARCVDGDSPVARHGLRRVQQQIQQRGAHEFAVGRDRHIVALDVDLHAVSRWIASDDGNGIGDNRMEFDDGEAWWPWSRKHHQVVDQFAQRVDACHDVAHDRQFGIVGHVATSAPG